MSKSPRSQAVGVNESLPLTTPKEKKSTLWQRIKDLFRSTKKKGKRCDNVPRVMKATMNKSSGSQVVGVNESPPLTTPKEKKSTLWQRIKHLFRRTKRKGKRCDNVPHGMSAEPGMGKQPLAEKLRSGASVKALLSMDNSELIEYLEDHLDVVRQFLDGHRGVLNDYVDEHIDSHSIKFWLAEKRGFHLSDRKYDEGGDIKFKELNEFKKNLSMAVVALKKSKYLEGIAENWVKDSTIEMLDDPSIFIDEKLKTYLRSNPHVTAALVEFTQDTQVFQELFSHYREIRKYIACHRSVLSDYVEEYIILQSIEFCLADQRGLLSKTPVPRGSKDDFSDEKKRHSNREFEEHEQIGNCEVIKEIGQGGLGFIYKAKNVTSSLEVALKKSKYLDGIAELTYEAEIMRRLDCPNIVKLIDVIENGISIEVVLVMEYPAGGSLHQLVLRKTFSLPDAWHVMKQMASAFAYMHRKNVVHRDIKLCNVLCNDQLVVKVIDFGLAKVLNAREKLFDKSGTRGYMAPEIAEGGYEGPPADVWSLGILFIQLFLGVEFNGSTIIKKKSDAYTYSKVFPKLPPNSGTELACLLFGMTYNEPILRFTMEEISHHKWFIAFPCNEGMLSKSPVPRGSKDDFSDEKKRHSNREFEEHEQIGNWEVIKEIGQGGFGFIYKAKNVTSSLEVALKKSKYLDGIAEKKSDAYTYSKVFPKLPPNSGTELACLLFGMTYNEPILRFTMEEISHHKWFTACPSFEGHASSPRDRAGPIMFGDSFRGFARPLRLAGFSYY